MRGNEQNGLTSRRIPRFRWKAAAVLCATLCATLCACHRRPPAAAAASDWVSALPATHEALSTVLASFPDGDRPPAWSRARAEALQGYLDRLARRGPVSNPELFPSNEAVLAYLVDAHMAWTLALGHADRLSKQGVDRLREEPITVDGRTTCLRRLMEEIAWRAPWEPRLALFLNAGWRGGPPFPTSAVEGRSLDWQLSLQAERCGRSTGFWTLDALARRVGVSACTEVMWGLPPAQPARARRLLDLVPPTGAARDAIFAACGASLQRCAVTLTPLDTARLFTTPETAR